MVDEDDEEGAKFVDCCAGKGRAAEAEVVLLGISLGGALLRCVGSWFPVDPPPFCDALCLTTFSISMCVSAVP